MADSFPPYAFIPGRFPHPESDPAGHSFGHERTTPAPLVPERWAESREYQRGLDLFNAGYYWEAHEAWEGLWHAAGRAGPVADFLKGLIRLAAVGVKVREGRADGIARHAAAAAARFRAHDGEAFLGFRIADLVRYAELAAQVPPGNPESEPAVRIVFSFVLKPA